MRGHYRVSFKRRPRVIKVIKVIKGFFAYTSETTIGRDFFGSNTYDRRLACKYLNLGIEIQFPAIGHVHVEDLLGEHVCLQSPSPRYNLHKDRVVNVMDYRYDER